MVVAIQVSYNRSHLLETAVYFQTYEIHKIFPCSGCCYIKCKRG